MIFPVKMRLRELHNNLILNQTWNYLHYNGKLFHTVHRCTVSWLHYRVQHSCDCVEHPDDWMTCHTDHTTPLSSYYELFSGVWCRHSSSESQNACKNKKKAGWHGENTSHPTTSTTELSDNGYKYPKFNNLVQKQDHCLFGKWLLQSYQSGKSTL